ncbi:MAG: protein kinase [Anaerolineaceae bacterium]|nr:protein kinase [Anaerolineaceae bacterium]
MDSYNYCYGCMELMPEGYTTCPKCGYDNSYPHNDEGILREGSVLNGKYLVGKKLGKGGFGVTYLGLELNLNVKVAIKEYFPYGVSTRTSNSRKVRVSSTTEDDMERYRRGRDEFQREAQTLARFNSPAIAHVREFFLENDTAYIVMDYVEGPGLNEEIKQNGRMAWQRVIQLMLPLMPELDRLHKESLIHRDIKPENIKIVRDRYTGAERLVLLDFGAARSFDSAAATGNYTAVLTPGYAPLEQHKRKSHQGPYTDVYALCATMYKAITGDTPPDAMDLMDGDDEIKPFSYYGLDVPANVENTILHGMALRAEERPQDMRQLYDEFYGNAVPPTPVRSETSVRSARPTNTAAQSHSVYSTPPEPVIDRDSIYDNAVALLGSDNVEDLEKARDLLDKIKDYRDSEHLKSICIRKIELLTPEIKPGDIGGSGTGSQTGGKKPNNTPWAVLGAICAVIAVALLVFSSKTMKSEPTATPTMVRTTAAVTKTPKPTAAPTRVPTKTPAKTATPYVSAGDMVKTLNAEKTASPKTKDEEMAASFDCTIKMGIYNAVTEDWTEYKGSLNMDKLSDDEGFAFGLDIENKTNSTLKPTISATVNGEEVTWTDSNLESGKSRVYYAEDCIGGAGTYDIRFFINGIEVKKATYKVTASDELIAKSFDCKIIMGTYNQKTDEWKEYSGGSYYLEKLKTDESFSFALSVKNNKNRAVTASVTATVNGKELNWDDVLVEGKDNFRFNAINQMNSAGTYEIKYFINGIEVKRATFIIKAENSLSSTYNFRIVMGIYNSNTDDWNEYSGSSYVLSSLKSYESFAFALKIENKTDKTLTPRVSATINGDSLTWNDMDVKPHGDLSDFASGQMDKAGTYKIVFYVEDVEVGSKTFVIK